MPVPARSIAEIIYKYVANNQICMNVLHYTNTVGSDTVEPLAATSALLAKVSDVATNALLNNMAVMQSNAVSYLSVSVQMVYPLRFIKLSADLAKVGQVIAPCTAQNLAAVITKLGDLGARNNVGSFHLGGLPETEYVGGLLTVDANTKLGFLAGNLTNSIIEGLTGITWDPCLANRTKAIVGGKPVYTLTGSTLLYTCVPQRTLRVMRRRTVGLGI